MKNSSLKLYLEINNLNYIFSVCEADKLDKIKIIYELELPLIGIENNRISDLEKVSDFIKKHIYIVEQKLNYTFKEIVLILENFDLTFTNLSGFKKLSGSQILRENVTYILNTLKSCIDENDEKKNVLHIFNSNFFLDNKKIENLPIGLFGDFYSHELSFVLINKSDRKNLKSVFDKCNLKIKKILVKSYVEGVNISGDNKNSETFFQITINKKDSKIFYFENNSLKFEQNFKFGTDVIIQDISKIISFKKDIVENILSQIKFTSNLLEEDLIEEKFFYNNNYRKIKKKLIYEIALARVNEIFELILLKNINFNYYNKFSKNIYLKIVDKSHYQNFREIYETTFSNNSLNKLFFQDSLSAESMMNSVHKLVHFGWKKEAIPISSYKKSLINRFFDKIFG
tara:strand:- start:4879 stop:6075 length:1197 start_codon:yes stop_codon:yes gene_type:complete